MRRVENFRKTAVGAASFFGGEKVFLRVGCYWIERSEFWPREGNLSGVFLPRFRRSEFDTGDIFGLTTTAVNTRKNCNCGKHEGKYVQQSRCF